MTAVQQNPAGNEVQSNLLRTDSRWTHVSKPGANIVQAIGSHASGQLLDVAHCGGYRSCKRGGRGRHRARNDEDFY
jgi:hypothetical protein